MKTVLVSPRRKVRQGMMLDAIPEDEEMGKEQRNFCNGLVRHRKSQKASTFGVTEVKQLKWVIISPMVNTFGIPGDLYAGFNS
ncbi:hypothetical protein OROGR_013446 [Orobanche gracilis]